jgi:hypothetical protein
MEESPSLSVFYIDLSWNVYFRGESKPIIAKNKLQCSNIEV